MQSSKLFGKFLLIGFVVFLLQTGVQAKDDWIKIRSKNFQLVSNASDKDVRAVAIRLEQFREVFRQLFEQRNFNSPMPVNVIVFKDEISFRDFKPVNGDGIREDWVKGYFQNGADADYIVLSTESDKSDKSDTYNTIFHEYIHFLVNNQLGQTTVPPWFNEGLAEYYATLQIEDDRKVSLGGLNTKKLLLLQQRKLIPFDTFFNMDNYTLHRQGRDGAGLFYSQAWILMHYLMQGNGGARREQVNKFTDLILNGKTAKAAFNEAFQTDYETMQIELEKYIQQKNFPNNVVNLKNKLTFDGEMQSSALTDSEAKAILGDLLYHTNRLNEAAALLEEVLKVDSDSSAANTSLGLVKLQQKNFVEAKKYLEKAVARDDKNYLAHFCYAYVLSREGMTDSGLVSGYDVWTATKMRASLDKSIALNPNFAESYNLYALINIVRNENIDEAKVYLDKALKLAPGNQWYLLHEAEIRMRKEDFSTARQIAQKVFETAPEDRLRIYAKTTISTINSFEAQLESIKNNRWAKSDVTDKPLTEEEMRRLNEKAMREVINFNLRGLKPNEKRVLGYLTNVECRANDVRYSVKVDEKTLQLKSENFDALRLITYDAEMSDGQIGCEPLKKEAFAVVTYRPSANADANSSGEIVAIEFVPKNFIFLN